MSLKREQWIEMFESMEAIEHAASNLGDIKKALIMRHVRAVKRMIESVVGQLK